MSGSKSHTFNFNSSIKSQVACADMMAAIAGKPPYHKCPKCGGITDKDRGVALAALCKCEEVEDEAIKVSD